MGGHLLNNPNLPIVGVPLHPSTRSAICCKICGEEVHQILSAEELKERNDKDDVMTALSLVFLVICVVLGILIGISRM